MLKTTRQILAVISIIMVTLLFLDFTGTVHSCFGWMAKIQFLPAMLALNTGVIIGLFLLTLIFGRMYCSVICPLGIMQDGFAWFGKKAKKNRYSYSPAKNILRYVLLVLMVIANHCIGCGQCTPHCPQSIDIPGQLHRIDTFVENLKQETL